MTRRGIAGAVVCAIVVGGTSILAGCADDGPTSAATTRSTTTSSSSVPAPTTTVAPDPPYLNRVAFTLTSVRSVKVYDGPGGSPVQEIANPNEHGVTTVFLVKRHDVAGPAGGMWDEVYLPVKPNGSTGWVSSADVEIQLNTVRLTIRRAEHQLAYSKDGVTVATYPIGVGKSGTETPTGTYFIKELLQPADSGGSYGPYAYGLSGFSSSLELGAEFGDGVIGIHGTNQPSKVGTDVSHGCIRLRNADITALVDAELPLGTPVEIVD